MASTFSSAGTSLDRKSLKRPDGFLSAIRGLFSQLSKHSTIFVLVVAVVLGLGLVAGYWMNHLEAKSDAARNALFLAGKSMSAELKAVEVAEKGATVQTIKKDKSSPEDAAAQASDSFAFKKLDVDAKFPETVKKLKAVEQDFGGTRAAFEARLKLGTLYFDHADYTKSLPWFEKAAQSAPGNFEKALALNSVGYANENLGKPADAVQSYQKALNLGEGGLKGDLLLGIARSYEALHDTAKARSTYDQILKDLPGSDHAKSAELYKNAIQ
jgi:tetratricopeptide (TPR) repeat protein